MWIIQNSKQKRILHTLIHCFIFCLWPLRQRSPFKTSHWCRIETTVCVQWASGGTAPLCRRWRKLAQATEWHSRMAGYWADGSRLSIQDEQGRRQVDWTLVGVGDLLRFSSATKRRRGREGIVEGRALITAVSVLLSLSLLSLSHSLSFSHLFLSLWYTYRLRITQVHTLMDRQRKQ